MKDMVELYQETGNNIHRGAGMRPARSPQIMASSVQMRGHAMSGFLFLG
ncbi:hypothetical protein ACFSQT_35735 [Mesorhizobium calcicola]|uniref:Uncharacterized protein n=1 Tax=Mesorhizobium calcicola TaxID=1300310 RepID=A0ABW4WQ04_9HYPH